jgi:hypothetical protein
VPGAAQDQAADLRVRREFGRHHAVELGELGGGVEVIVAQAQAFRPFVGRGGTAAAVGHIPDVLGSLFHVEQVPFYILY